jgi:hypothetical protein
MFYQYLKRCSVLVLLLGIGRVSVGQIRGVDPGPHCLDEHIDAPAACSLVVFCTQPPDPIPAFVIGANAFKTCSNQPVDNAAQADAAIGGVQASSSGKAIGVFFNRLIKQQIRVADCAGNTAVLQDFDDPQGCNPPPPPPPPSSPQCDGGDGGAGFTRGSGGNVTDCSPIIIDTTGNGFQLSSAVEGAFFDISGNGTPTRVGWPVSGSGNAFLALPGTNGIVNNGTQLFGNFTPQPESSTPNGFAALAVYDQPDHGGNADEVIDEKDQIFSSLRLWADDNHDGVCQPNELHRLPEMGVLSISLQYSESGRTDQFGNVFRFKAKVNAGVSSDSGVGRQAYDVFLTAK